MKRLQLLSALALLFVLPPAGDLHAGSETPEQHLVRCKNAMRGTFLEHGWLLANESSNQQEFTHPLSVSSAFLAGLAQQGQDGLQHIQVTFQPQDDGLVKFYLAVRPPLTKPDQAAAKAIIDEAGAKVDAGSKKLGINYKKAGGHPN